MKRILLQGITSENHLTAVRHVLALDCPERVMISAAFMNKRGILLLSEALKPVAKQTIILAGIRNGITSSQGLEACLELGCAVYVVDTGSQQTLFHPKIYMSRNSNGARLAIGSANLTNGGLRNNIEASLLLDLALNNPDDKNLICELENELDRMRDKYRDNVFHISSQADIESLLETGRVIDERKASRPDADSQRHEKDTVPRMNLKTKSRVSEKVIVPAYIHFFIPLQKALRQLDGSGTNREIYKHIVQIMELSEEQLAKRDGRARTVVSNRIAHAKKQLGPEYHKYIERTSGDGGGYRLTEKGLKEDINENDLKGLMKNPD